MNSIVEKLADGISIYYLDLSDQFLMPNGSLNRELMPDLVHPGEMGFEVWAEAVKPLVSKSLEEK